MSCNPSYGPLLQLSAVSELNVKYLTGEPSYSLFQSETKQPTNHAISEEIIPMDSDGRLGRKNVIVKLPRSADIINKLWVCIDLPGLGKNAADRQQPYYKDFAGYELVEKAALYINNQCIETLSGEFLKVRHLLHDHTMEDEAVLNFPSQPAREYNSIQAQRAYVRLPFSFIEQGAIMAAIQHQDLEVRMTLKTLKDVVENADNAQVRESIALIGKSRAGQAQVDADGMATGGSIDDASASAVSMLAQCIYVDDAERAFFQNDYRHTALITQMQQPMQRSIGAGHASQIELNLPFNNPCRDLVWMCRGLGGVGGGAPIMPDPVANVQFRVNNNPRFFANDGKPVEGRFFRLVTVARGYPMRDHKVDDEFLYAYNFDTQPTSFQPGASMNMGKIDHCIFSVEFDTSYTSGEFYLFARSWNAVEYIDGKVHLLYAN
jgi:hypothetical protein